MWLGRKRVALNPCVEEEESLKIPAWKERSRSKSLRGRRGVAQNPCVEGEESLKIPAWHPTNNRRRARLVIALLDLDLLDVMPTDNLIWMMQSGFQSLTARRAHH